MVGPMRKHIRTSKYGKKFVAGSKVEIEQEVPQEEENLLDSENEELTIEADDMKRIEEETNETPESILSKALELKSTNPDEIIASLNVNDNEE